MFRNAKVVYVAALLLLTFSTLAQAQFIAFDAPLQAGNQSWGGPLGMDFDVNSPIVVTRIGIFDSDGDGFSGTLQAAIFNRNTGTVVAGTIVTFTQAVPGTLVNGHRFLPLPAPVTLVPGQYSIVATGFSEADPNGNSQGVGAITTSQNTGGGLISFPVASRYDNAAGLYYPTIFVAETARFLAGTFQFAAAPTTVVADAIFQVRYVANLNVADALVNMTNTGANGAMPFGPGIGPQAGNICVNVYAFAPDEQMVGCCSCHITPNGLASLSVYNDIRGITLTGLTPNSMMIKLVATATGGVRGAATYTGGASSCAQSAAGLNVTHPITSAGLAAWATSGHVPGLLAVPGAPAPFAITETPFTPATLSQQEIDSLNNRCTAIIGNGSTFGTCRSCTLGGRGSARQ